MNELVRKDILVVLDKVIESINKQDYIKLKGLSDQVIHNASIFQDEDSLSIAVIIYTIAKIYRHDELVDKTLIEDVANAKMFLEKRETEKYRETIKRIFEDVAKTASKKNNYVNEVLERAEINKGSKMFYHGISLGRVAETLGISRWELMEYVGKTKIADSYEYETNIDDKMEFVRSIFGVGK